MMASRRSNISGHGGRNVTYTSRATTCEIYRKFQVADPRTFNRTFFVSKFTLNQALIASISTRDPMKNELNAMQCYSGHSRKDQRRRSRNFKPLIRRLILLRCYQGRARRSVHRAPELLLKIRVMLYRDRLVNNTMRISLSSSICPAHPADSKGCRTLREGLEPRHPSYAHRISQTKLDGPVHSVHVHRYSCSPNHYDRRIF